MRPYQPPHRIVVRPGPRFDRAFGGRLLLVGGAEWDPVAARRQHRMEIVDAAEVVAQLGLTDPDDERGRVQTLVTECLELG